MIKKTNYFLSVLFLGLLGVLSLYSVTASAAECFDIEALKQVAGDLRSDNYRIHPDILDTLERLVAQQAREPDADLCNYPLSVTALLDPVVPHGSPLYNDFEKSQQQFRRYIESLEDNEPVECLTTFNFCRTRIPADAVLKIMALDDVIILSGYNELIFELELQTESLGLMTRDDSERLPQSWWAAEFDGSQKDGNRIPVVGIIDNGVDIEHPALADKTFEVQANAEVKTAHGTGMACIYASTDPIDRGVAFGLERMVIAMTGFSSFDTMRSVEWMMQDTDLPPTVMNLSVGSQNAHQVDWGVTARFYDALVNHYGVMIAKSAGNTRRDEEGNYVSGWDAMLTAPGDNYNFLTVANMNFDGSLNPNDHGIRYLSRRGPTLEGRRKPDITAPGTGTYTCAIEKLDNQGERITSQGRWDEEKDSDWRSLGGTSAAAAYVGGAAALLNSAGIFDPKVIRAILINSADTWTDSDNPGPDDRVYDYDPIATPHEPVLGSQWNRSYGWGLLNLEKAYQEYPYARTDRIAPKGQQDDVRFYRGEAALGDKITLAWERRVGLRRDQSWIPLAHLDLALYSLEGQLLDSDTSAIDNVKQVANYPSPDSRLLPNDYTDQEVIVAVSSLSPRFYGVETQSFALAPAMPLYEIAAPRLRIKKTTFRGHINIRNIGDLPINDLTLIITLENGEEITEQLEPLLAGEQRRLLRRKELKQAKSAQITGQAFGVEFDEQIL